MTSAKKGRVRTMDVEFSMAKVNFEELCAGLKENDTVIPGLPNFHGIPLVVDRGVPSGEVQLHRVESGRCKCIALPVLDDPPPRHPMTAQEKEVLQEFWKMFLSDKAEKLQAKRTLLTAAALVTDKWKAFLAFSDAARDEDDTVLAELKVAMEELRVMVESEIESIPETKRQP